MSDNAYEFEFVLKIPTSRIFQRNVQYKYCIKKVDNSGEEKYPWEHYIKKGSTGMGANRNLTLNERWRDIGNIFNTFALTESAKSIIM